MPRVRRGFGGKLLSCRISRGLSGGRMAALPGGRGGGVGKISQVIERLENEYGNAIARSRG